MIRRERPARPARPVTFPRALAQVAADWTKIVAIALGTTLAAVLIIGVPVSGTFWLITTPSLTEGTKFLIGAGVIAAFVLALIVAAAVREARARVWHARKYPTN